MMHRGFLSSSARLAGVQFLICFIHSIIVHEDVLYRSGLGCMCKGERPMFGFISVSKILQILYCHFLWFSLGLHFY